jgi:hypothetical protein
MNQDSHYRRFTNVEWRYDPPFIIPRLIPTRGPLTPRTAGTSPRAYLRYRITLFGSDTSARIPWVGAALKAR